MSLANDVVLRRTAEWFIRFEGERSGPFANGRTGALTVVRNQQPRAPWTTASWTMD